MNTKYLQSLIAITAIVGFNSAIAGDLNVSSSSKLDVSSEIDIDLDFYDDENNGHSDFDLDLDNAALLNGNYDGSALGATTSVDIRPNIYGSAYSGNNQDVTIGATNNGSVSQLTDFEVELDINDVGTSIDIDLADSFNIDTRVESVAVGAAADFSVQPLN